MAKISLNNVASGYNRSKINQNFVDLQAELQDKVFYRDNPTGEPNQMENDMDMNSNDIANAKDIYTGRIQINGKWVTDAEETSARDADTVTYDNTTSGLTATELQAATDEIDGRVDTTENRLDNVGAETLDTASGTGQALSAALDDRVVRVGSVAEGIQDLNTSFLTSRNIISVIGWQSGSDIGGDDYYWSATTAKSDHDGSSVISLTVPKVSAQSGATLNERTENFINGVNEIDPSGVGCLVTKDNKALRGISQYGCFDGSDATFAARKAQSYLSNRFGGGNVVFDVKGQIKTVSDLIPDASFADYAIDVLTGIEFSAVPGCQIVADKNFGGDVGGYCMFHIAEGKKNIKIHDFYDVDGIDKSTVKGLGQIVAIRGSDLNPCANIEIFNFTGREIRDEPFRLGQTTGDDQFLADNVEIYNIDIDGCSSHGVLMRSLQNSNASGLRVKNAGRLGIDISSNNYNCHLTAARGINVFLGTRGGFKIEGNSGANPSTHCSASGVYYDGAFGDGNGAASADGYCFRLTGDDLNVKDIVGKNCGGTGISFFQLAPGRTMNIKKVLIDTVIDVGDATFIGSAYTFRDNLATARDNRNVTMQAEFRNCPGVTHHYLGGMKAEIRMKDCNGIRIDGTVDGVVQDTELRLYLDNTRFEEINGGVSRTTVMIDRAVNISAGQTAILPRDSGDFTLLYAKNVNILGTLFNCQDIAGSVRVTNVSGVADRMVRFSGTLGTVLCSDVEGDCTTSLISQPVSGAVTKGVVVNTVATGAANDILGSGLTVANNV